MMVLGIPFEIRVRRDKIVVDVAPLDFDRSGFGAALDARNLVDVINNNDSVFRRISMTSDPFLGNMSISHPQHGEYTANFPTYSPLSSWIAVPWDPLSYPQLDDSYSTLKLFTTTPKECPTVWEIWKYNVFAIPPNPEYYMWYVYFYRFQYHYHNYEVPYSGIIPLLIPLAQVFGMFLNNGATTGRRKLT